MDKSRLIQQYLQHRSEFMGYLYAITRDAEFAEEIYQNAAVIMIEKESDDETIRHFRGWAKEVIRRQALHAIRKREASKRTGIPMSPELLDAVGDVFVNDASEHSLVIDESVALKSCLGELPAPKREMIKLRYEQNASFQEISESTGLTPAAVQRAISRIRKLLHGCIQKRMRMTGEAAG